MDKEKTTGTIVLAVGAILLWFLYSNGQLGAAATQDTGQTTAAPTAGEYGVQSPSVNFNVNTNMVDVVSYIPLFGFIGVGQFWS